MNHRIRPFWSNQLISIFHLIFLEGTIIPDQNLATTTDGNGTARAAYQCKGGQGKYVSYSNNNMNNGGINAGHVGDCFRSLPAKTDGHGCQTNTVGICSCTRDSSWIWSYMQTYREAIQNLRRDSNEFNSVEAERYEGNMYLSYTCYV